MHLRISSAALALVLTSALPGSAAAAVTHPGMPEAFHGPVAGVVGAVIEARIGGIVAASTTVEAGQVYGYAPRLFLIPDPLGTRAGASIAFSVDGNAVSQVATFVNGAIVELALGIASTTASSSPATSTSSTTPVETNTGGANTVGTNEGQSGTVSTPAVTQPNTNTPIKTLARRYDLTGDGRVNLADFNFLIAHWGSRGKGTPADIDADGAVGLLDFNLLLSHWSL